MGKILQRALGIIMGAIIAFILSSAVPAIEFGGLSMPSLVGIANACDEFHGDNNCTCQQSIFNPCCPWWKDKSQWDASCFPAAALSQGEKDDLWRSAERMGRAAKYFALIAATAKSFGSDEVSTTIAKLAAAAALGSQWAQAYLEAEAADPWDEDYPYPYDAPWWSAAQLGVEYCAGEGVVAAYCNAFIDTIPRVQRNGEGAYVSLNRSGTCRELVNWDCAGWQADRAKWYMRQQGDAMRDAGYYLWVVRDNTNDMYSAECDCWLSQALYEAAGDFWDSGEYLRNRY